MEETELPQVVVVIFVILVIFFALSEYVIGLDLSWLIDPLTDIFVPIFILAVIIALVWAMIREILE